MVMYFIDRRPRITDQLQVCHDTLTCVLGREKGKKAMTPGILNSQVLKSDFNSKILNFNFGFTSY